MNSDGALNGYGYAAGVLLGQMAFALPVYLARVQLYAIGRDDKEEFLERATSGEALATAAMNYSSMSGLGSDAMDMVASLGAGWNSDVKAALGSHSFGRGLSSAVPVVGTLDQAGRVVTGRASVHQALKQLPFSNLPWLVPFINLTAEDD